MIRSKEQRAKKESKRPQTSARGKPRKRGPLEVDLKSNELAASARGEPRKRGPLEVDLKSNELTASDPNLNLIAIWVGTTNSEP